MATSTQGPNGINPMADKDLDKDLADDERDDHAERDDREERALARGREEGPDEDERDEESRPAVTPSGAAVARPGAPGWFAIYKPGQGYWTRMCTACGVGLVVLVILAFFYNEMGTWGIFIQGQSVRTGLIVSILGAVVLVVGIWAFRIMNRPKVVDFLIATESEMKKVNWTSKKDLIGSTKVVILFMFMIALTLFVIDILFGYFFQFIRVLEFGPFG